MTKYPLHEKLKTEHDSPQGNVLAEFIDFLAAKGIHFAKYPPECELEGEDCDWGTQEEHTWWERRCYHGEQPYKMYSVGGETQYSEWIAEFYGIDLKAFDAEKEAIYQELVKSARKG